jgi:hypothetical protein
MRFFATSPLILIALLVLYYWDVNYNNGALSDNLISMGRFTWSLVTPLVAKDIIVFGMGFCVGYAVRSMISRWRRRRGRRR